MNFVGKFDAKLQADGSGAHAHHHADSITAHAPSGAIIVPDADLLFHGDFKRSGVDLVLSRNDHEWVVEDYFKGEKRVALASPDGAHLTGDIINALAGHVQYAQADGSAGAGKVIGHVTKLTGTATAIRNGVSIILNQGDNVEKGDVVQSGSSSTLGVTFIDGTVFGLSSNARMVLNEMVYDPNGSDNSSLISLVAGTISFVAGQTAKHGDMKIDTPVATMGIRGTAVLVEIDFDVPGQNGKPEAKFQVLVEPDGTTGSYILFDKNTFAPIALVDKAGQQVHISENNLSFSDSSLSPELQKLVTDVFTWKFSNATPQSFTHLTDTLSPQTFPLALLPNGAAPTATILLVTPSSVISGTSSTPPPGGSPIPHINQPPVVTTVDSSFIERAGLSGNSAIDTTSGTINFADINLGDRPTAKATISSFTYQNAQHQDIAATVQELADIQALEKIPLSVVQAPGNTYFGTATWTFNVPDKAFDFLGAGDTLTLTYKAEVDSNYSGGSIPGFANFTITITGTNDAPVITTGPETVAFVNVGTGTTGPSLPPTGPTTNKLKFKDPDLTDTHTVSTHLTAAILSDAKGAALDMQALEAKFPRPMGVFESALSAAVTTDSTGTGAGTITWTLADISSYYADIVPDGETLTLTYTVTVKDSQGATSSQKVTVTITGNDAPAVVWVETTADPLADPTRGDWNGANNWETGTVPTASDDVIIITNQLQGQTPLYPVTIKAGGAAAFAHSVTMDNFDDLANAPGATAPELDIGRVLTQADVANGVVNGSLTIGTDISLSADAILKVFGTLSVGTIAKILGNSVLHNYSGGLITLGQGGEFGDSSSITNAGTIEVVSDTLDVRVNIANSGGALHIDNGATLKLSSATAASTTITGGNLTLGSGSTLDVESIGGATLDGVTVIGTNASTGPIAVAASLIEIGAAGSSTLKLDDGTSIKNGNLTIAAGSTLDIEKGLTALAKGVPDATLDGVTVGGGGAIEVSKTTAGAVLTLTDGTTVTGGTLDIATGGEVYIQNGSGSVGATLDHVTVTGGGEIEIGSAAPSGSTLILSDGTTISGVTLTLEDTTDVVDIEAGANGKGVTLTGMKVSNSGTLSIGDDATLTLNGATIDGGAINNGAASGTGHIDVSGLSAITNDILNNGDVTIAAGAMLTLDGDTVNGTTISGSDATSIVQVDGHTTLTLNGATIKNVTINDFTTSGGIIAGDIKVTGSSTISGAHLNNGNVTIAGGQTLKLTGDTVMGTNFIDTAGGAAILIDGTATLDEVTVTGGTITNSGALLTIDADQTLTLQDGARLVGGTLSNSGTLYVESSSGATLDGVNLTGSGSIQVDVVASSATPTLVLDDGAAITGGTLTVGPFGTLAVETAGGATLNGVNVTNGKSIEVFAGSVLTFDQVTTVDNSTGAIAIDGTAMLTLNDAFISGGTVTNNGTLTLDGNAALKDGNLLNFSQINVSSTVNELSNEKITNASAIAILALGVLTLDHLTTVDNTGGIITVYGTGVLVLNDATINGGTINDFSTDASGGIIAGDIDVTGSSTISGDHLNNGQVTIKSGVVLTLDNDTVTGTHFDDTASGATIQVDGGTTLKLDGVIINGGIINDFSTDTSGNTIAGDIDIVGSSTISNDHLNNGQATIKSGVVLTLDNDTVTGTHFNDTASGATIQVDGGTMLKLDGVIISGGTINDFSIDASGNAVAGDIDIVGSSTISDANLNQGNVTVESGQKLTLDGDTVNGTAFTNVAADSVIHVDGGDTLTLNDTTTITGGGLTIDAGALVKTSGDVTLTSTSVGNDGKIEVTDGILKITGSVGDSTPGGSGSIQIDNGAVLDLNASDTQNVIFSGDSGKLQIDTSSFGGYISGLTAGDQIDLSTIGYGPNTTGTYSNGILTITDGVHSISMTLTGDYSNAHFAGSSDGHGGTLITLNANDDVPAFAAADKSESATVKELADTTGSSASDPSPAASGTLHFTDIDLTDRPTVTDFAQSVTLTVGATMLSSSEIQTLENAFSLTQPVNTNNGSLAWTYQIGDSSLDFLGAGEKATVTSTITLDDHHGGTDTATVTVTVEGANDLPTIVAETDPSVQTVILNKSPVVLGAGVSTNSLELPAETFDNLSAGSASINGFGHGNFTSTALGATFTASGAAGIVHGSSSVTSAPFIGPLPGHADATNYLSIGAHGSETISFASEHNEFGLYWGSADAFNTISFYDGSHLVASYSGADVAPLLANGNQGSFGSNGYVEFSDLAPFDKVVLASSSSAFEVDNISAGFVSDSHIHLPNPIAGTLAVSDADIGDTLTASVTGDAVAEYNGSTTLPSNVNVSALIDSGAITFDTVKTTGGQDVLDWTYNPTNADLDFLEPGDKLTLTFNARVSDGHALTESQPLTVTLLGSGASIVDGTAQNDIFVNVGGGVKIFGHGGQDTFVFNKNFGSATIGDFNVNTDTIEIDKSLFATVSALLQNGAHSANSGHDTIIVDAAHDQITLSGVTLAQLQAHPNDFHLI